MTPAVVLTLRKRYSIRGEGNRQRTEGESTAATSGPRLGEVAVNPWQDEVSDSPTDGRRPSHLHHRLSFDHPSGVIMLPDDGTWLEEESDSDEDYGVQRERPGDRESGQEEPSAAGQVSQPTSPSKRYATYYHHPERRKRS